MFVRNLLRSGDFCTPVPLGLPVTLQYNDIGVLEKLFIGYGYDKEPCEEEYLRAVLDNTLVPISIPLKDGTSWVSGVLQYDQVVKKDGLLPHCIESTLLSKLKSSPKSFKFKASSVKSNVTQFANSIAIRRWLPMAGFDMLPGFIVPATLNRSSLMNLLRKNLSDENPVVTHYVVFRGGEELVLSVSLRQIVVKKIERYTDGEGYIHARLHSAGDSYSCSYSQLVALNIHEKDIVVLDDYGVIVSVLPVAPGKREAYPTKLTCEACGNIIQVVSGSEVQCPDAHCVSRLIPRIRHFCTTLGITVPLRDTLSSLIASGAVTRVSDLLDIEPYSEMKIEASLATLLAAFVLPDEVPDRSVFEEFTRCLNNSVESLIYFMSHPDKIEEALVFSGNSEDRLVDWFYDAENVSEVHTGVESPVIALKTINQKFEGDPIFRGSKIMITGTFSHGSLSEIEAILRSYDATVVTEFSPDVNVVVVGDNNDGVSGQAIRKAKKQHIPIYSESRLFKEYEIDNDLGENL